MPPNRVRAWGRRIAIAAAVLAACAAPTAAATRVLVTIKPVHSLVAAVMAGEPEPQLLIDGATSPHTYAMRPSDARRLAEAQVVVRVSRGLELFLDKPLAVAAGRARVVTLDKIAGMTLYPLRGGDENEAQSHGHDHAHDHGGDNVDPHLWLDPANARIAALAIAEALAAVSPADAGRYRDNARSLVARLDDLDRRLATELSPVSQQGFVVFHDAYQYFERRYGLRRAASVSANPEVPPSARRLSRLRASLKEARVVCVFAEPQFPPRAIETIVEGTGIRQATLDPLGATLPAGPSQYFDLMQALAADLVRCLKSNG